MQRVPVGERCLDCGTQLQHKGAAARTVMDVEPRREMLMSALHTLHKRSDHVTDAFQRALDRLVQNRKVNLYKLLFRCDSS